MLRGCVTPVSKLAIQFDCCGNQLFFLPHVVRVNRVLISDVKPATRNHWMRPRRQRALLDSESSLLSIRSWISFDQTNHSVFAERVEMSIGVCERTLADTAVLPRNFAIIKTHR